MGSTVDKSYHQTIENLQSSAWYYVMNRVKAGDDMRNLIGINDSETTSRKHYAPFDLVLMGKCLFS
jgi:hypothetical protein